MARNKTEQFAEFTRALSDVFKVSHAEMKQILLKDKKTKAVKKRKVKKGASARECLD